MSESMDILNHFVLESSASRDVFNEVIDKLTEIGYFNYPGSIKYHDNYVGGLAYHSIKLATYLYDWTKIGLINWSPMYRSIYLPPILVGILHDICKLNKYKLLNGNWDYNPNALEGHGDLSLKLLNIHFRNIKFTNEVKECIRYHMGVYDNDFAEYDKAIKKYPNIMWTHHADMLSSKL